MTGLRILLLVLLIICTITVSFSKNLLVSVVIYMAFSLVMSIIWLILESPDLAITEAAVGAGVTSILFFVTLKKIRSIRTTAEEDIDE
ncbi:MAG: hydrogenase subunit MbhD domain-containing protein [Coprococcus sp.]